MQRPIIGITMGTASGIGPEICLKALTQPEIYDYCDPLIFGDIAILRETLPLVMEQNLCQQITFTDIQAQPNLDLSSFDYEPCSLLVHHCEVEGLLPLTYGADSALLGKTCGQYIESAVQWALDDKIHGIVTAPISKVSFKQGGWGERYPGHTEMLADLTGTQRFSMMLAHGNIRVVHVTSHLALREAIEQITFSRVLETIELAHEACILLGIVAPRIAVCGLNPHAGEGGAMGMEEIEIIQPAIEHAQTLGIDAHGPFPSDTIWPKVASGTYNIAVAMYHDQGGIPVKLSGFQYDTSGQCQQVSGINVTIGIPVIRVSVDHGTAYDIAGKGIASPESLIDAIRVASQLAQNKYSLRDNA